MVKTICIKDLLITGLGVNIHIHKVASFIIEYNLFN